MKDILARQMPLQRPFLEADRNSIQWVGRVVALVLLAVSLGRSQNAVLDSLARVLKTGDEYDRIEAVEELGKLRSEPAAAILASVASETAPARFRKGVPDRNPALTQVAEAAARVLGQMGSIGVEPLIRLLQNPSPYVRGAAARALFNTGDARRVAPLVGLLGDPDPAVRSNATAWLNQLSAEARNLLIAAMASRDSLVREGAASALGGEPDTGLTTLMIRALKDPDSRVRASAAYALRWNKDRSAVEPLLAVLKDRDLDVRNKAATALGGIKDERALPPLIAALGDPDSHDAVGLAFFHFGPSAGEPLIAALQDSNRWVRKGSIGALGNLAYKPAIGPLTAALRDRDTLTAIAAAWALAQMKDTQVIPGLRQAVRDSVSSVRLAALRAMLYLSNWVPLDRNLGPKVFPLFTDPDRDIRFNAAYVLASVRYKPVFAPLVKTLQAGKSAVDRAQAAQALGLLGDTRAIPFLIPALSDCALGDSNSSAMQQEPLTVRVAACHSLAGFGAPAVEALVGALSNRDSLIRDGATRALGNLAWRKVDLSSAVGPLAQCLSDPSSSVRTSAIWTLQSIKDPRAIRPLLLALRDDSTENREAITMTLRNLGDTATAVLLASLRDDNPRVRWAAASLLIDERGSSWKVAVSVRPQAALAFDEALKRNDVAVVAGAHLYFLRLGKPGTEKLLVEALRSFGTHAMAQHYWWSGHAPLQRAADEWSGRKSYHEGKDSGWGPKWGGGCGGK